MITVFVIAILTLTACNSEELKPTNTAEIANPASVFCAENGGTLEMRQAADGSVSGFCLFADGSECDEWSFFKGECSPIAKKTATPFIISETTQVATENSAGENASGGNMTPGTSEDFADWWGVIKSTPSGAQYDDYFERQDLGQPFIYFGIGSIDPTVQAQITTLSDSGKIVHLYGTLSSNVPDYNCSQVLIDRIEVEGN